MDNLRPLQLMVVQKEDLKLFKKENVDYGVATLSLKYDRAHPVSLLKAMMYGV